MSRAALRPYTVKQRYVPKNAKHEESLQRQVCTYLRLQYPHVIFRSDYASGLHLSISQATIHKSMQSGRSFPDLFLFKPMQHGDKYYAGMALELKREGTTIILKTGPRKGHISSNIHIQEQAAVLKELSKLGYYSNFAVGIKEALKLIDWYLQKPQNAALF